MKLTVFYDGQFWVAIAEQTTDAGLTATRHIFGAEPPGEEVLEFVNRSLSRLMEAQTQAVTVDPQVERKVNPKRLARQVMREAIAPVSTKAQEAIQLQMEVNKKEKQVQSKQQRLDEQERKWSLNREKAKKRHRGK